MRVTGRVLRKYPVSARQAAIDRGVCQDDVDIVLERLREVDRDMEEAGAIELERALPPGTTRAYRREIAAVVWRAMLARAR